MEWTVIGAIALGGAFVYLAVIYCWNKLLNKKINFREYRFYLALFLLTLAGTLLNSFAPTYIKLLGIIVSLLLVNYFLISKKLSICITSIIIVQGIAMLSEVLVAFIGSLFIGDYLELFMKQPFGIVVFNVCMAILLMVFFNLKIIYKLYNYLMVLLDNMKRNNLIICCLATVLLAVVFMVMSYMQLPTIAVSIINSLLVIIYVSVVIRLMSSQAEFEKINGKYQTSLSSLKESETIIDQHRIDNHENKNQLLIIRNMVKAKDKNTVKYIDTLIDNKINDNENIFYKTSKIPEGGLRFTIYSKLCKMKDMGIEYSLEIANEVSAADLINMDDNTMLNICKIIGVFLDNAIEAVEELDEKDIIVEIFIMDNNLCIEISNNYKDVINLDKISNTGYSTKGKGHGYGLSLVSELVKKDSNLENEKEISKDLFTQRLKIKM